MLIFRLSFVISVLFFMWTTLITFDQRRARALTVGCQIVHLPHQAQDPLAKLLGAQSQCPQNVHAFRQLLQQSGAKLVTTQVANRGYHNPQAGSFSLFETATGTLSIAQQQIPVGEGALFFGHFTEARGDTLSHQDQPDKGALMIELISWDPAAEVFRFYEMIGSGQQGEWFYRGDSFDIRADIRQLHLQDNPQKPVFGNRLRCSACHLAGGPIMKEIDLPHNDWWTQQRPLPLTQSPDAKLNANLSRLTDASHLAQAVKAGMNRLNNSKPFQKTLQDSPLPEQLRPLFCAEEVNLASDSFPLGQRKITELPSSIFIDSRLLPTTTLRFSQVDYTQALRTLQATFPEIQRTDADHAWLAPVKAHTDIQAVNVLIQRGVLDSETVADVLAVDMLQPVVSTARCQLLRTVPTQWTVDWQKQWRYNLAHSPLPAAQELLSNLQDPRRNQVFHQQRARNFVQACQKQPSQEVATRLLNWSGYQRQAIFTSEIAKHPRGQIFEPGFRVIFPDLQLLKQTLDLQCQTDTPS